MRASSFDIMQVRVNLGGGPRLDDDGNIVGGKMVDMVVEGNEVYIVSIAQIVELSNLLTLCPFSA